jgi:hypothetical protein
MMSTKKTQPETSKNDETLPPQTQGLEAPKNKPKLETIKPDGPCGGTPCLGGFGSD